MASFVYSPTYLGHIQKLNSVVIEKKKVIPVTTKPCGSMC